MISDIKNIIDLFSQLNPLQSWLLLGALFGLAAIFHKWGLPALEKWRERKNKREAKDRQILENTNKNKELEQKYTTLEQRLQSLENKHNHDMQEVSDDFTNKMLTRKHESQVIVESWAEKLDVLLEAVNKIREEATEREINNLRYKIIRFAKELRCGDPKSQDEYNHIFQTIDDYHKILDKLGRENGQIDIEVTFIKNQYMHHLETNDFVV